MIEKPYTALLSDLFWFLSCNKKFKNLTSHELELPKTDLETNVLDSKNRSFEYLTFFISNF